MAHVSTGLVQWDANTEPDLAGYRVYYGQYPGLYLGYVQVGLTLSATLTSSQYNNDGLWYHAVTAFDTSNNESIKSSVVSKRIVRTDTQFKVQR